VVDPPVIETVEYVADSMNPLLNKEGASPSGTEQKDKDKGDQKRDERPPIAVNMR